MKLYSVGIVALTLSGLLLPVLAKAGALDRGPMQQRYNQAAEEMLRVPGVVGMYEQDAMAILQQAGVAPEIKYSKTYQQNLAGKEGTVIAQDPGAGGVSMLGSIVSITVYLPPSAGDLPASGPDGQYGNDGGGQWDEQPVSSPPPAYEEPVPQWGGGSQPAGGGGWLPPSGPIVQPAIIPPPARPATIEATPVNPTVTPVAPRAATPAATPIQQQLDTKVPARVEIRKKIQGAERTLAPSLGTGTGGGITARPITPTGTPAKPATGTGNGQQRPASIIMTPVHQTVTPVKQQQPGTTSFTASPVQPTAMRANQPTPKATTFKAKAVPQTATAVSQGRQVTQSQSDGRQTPQDGGSCRSWRGIATDTYKQAVKKIENLGVSLPGFREATCDVLHLTGVGTDKWRRCIEWMDSNNVSPHWTASLVNWFNNETQHSWAHIGPRPLELNRPEKGRLVSTTGRVFITPAPLVNDSVSLRLSKVAGKAKTEVTVCSYTPSGTMTKEWHFMVPNGKKNKGQQWTKSLRRMRAKILSVHLDSKSAANTFQYIVFLEEN